MTSVAAISVALRAHDPLDPWLTESNWDDSYWDAEAEQIASRLTSEMSTTQVRAVVTDVLRSSLSVDLVTETNDAWRAERLDAVAAEIWQSLRA